MIFVCQGGRRDRPWPVPTGGGCRDVLAKRLYKHCVPPKFYENNAEFPPEFFTQPTADHFSFLRHCEGAERAKQSLISTQTVSNKRLSRPSLRSVLAVTQRLFVIPAKAVVIPAKTVVIPAKAGISPFCR